jgi:hypothetical protein
MWTLINTNDSCGFVVEPTGAFVLGAHTCGGTRAVPSHHHLDVGGTRAVGQSGLPATGRWLRTPAPHSSDRPQAGGYTGEPAKAFSSGWFVVEPVASVAKFFTIESREKDRNSVEATVRQLALPGEYRRSVQLSTSSRDARCDRSTRLRRHASRFPPANDRCSPGLRVQM